MMILALMIFLQLRHSLLQQCQILLLFIIFGYGSCRLLLRSRDKYWRAGVIFSRLKEELDAWLLRLRCSLAWLR